MEQAKERQRQILEKKEQVRIDRELEQKRELAQETQNTLMLTEQKRTLEVFFRTMQASYAASTQTHPTATIPTPDPGNTEILLTITQDTKRTRSPTNSPDRLSPSVRCSQKDNNDMSVWEKDAVDLEKCLTQEPPIPATPTKTSPTQSVDKENA